MSENTGFRYTGENRGLACSRCGAGAQHKDVPCANCGENIFDTPTDAEVLKTGAFLSQAALDSLRAAQKPRRPKRAA